MKHLWGKENWEQTIMLKRVLPHVNKLQPDTHHIFKNKTAIINYTESIEFSNCLWQVNQQ